MHSSRTRERCSFGVAASVAHRPSTLHTYGILSITPCGPSQNQTMRTTCSAQGTHHSQTVGCCWSGFTGQHVLNIFGLPSVDDDDAVFDFSSGVITGRWDDVDASGDQNSPASSKPLSQFLTTLLEDDLYVGVHTHGKDGGVAFRAQIERPGATELTLPVTGDTFTRKDKPDLNLGTLDYTQVNGVRFTYLLFDASALNGGIVSSATLHVPVRSTVSPGVLIASYLLFSWEKLAAAYNSAPPANSISDQSVTLQDADDGVVAVFDVTNRVRAWAADPATAWGFGLTREVGLNVQLKARKGGDGAWIEVVINP